MFNQANFSVPNNTLSGTTSDKSPKRVPPISLANFSFPEADVLIRVAGLSRAPLTPS
jgi:hypothetical protein